MASKEKKVRVAVVGMGIGRPNGAALSRNPRGEVVALCDLEEERMKAFAKDLPSKVEFYTDYKKMCKADDIDAVFVGTPNQWHAPIAMEAIKNGKHVMVTKPLADSEEAAAELVNVAEASDVVNMMSLSTRFGRQCQYLGKLYRDDYFGEIYYARARSVRRSGIPDWNLGFIQKGGGAFRDMGVHVLDSVWWIMGMPTPVSVLGAAGAKFGPRGLGYWKGVKAKKELYEKYDSDDYAGGFITFENGIGLQVESFWASHQPGEFQIELFGTEAGATMDPLKAYRTDKNGDFEDIDLKPPKSKYGETWDAIAGHFIECILDDVECQAPLRHGLIVQKMMEGLLRSGETGREELIEVE